MKKSIIAVLLVGLLAACTKDQTAPTEQTVFKTSAKTFLDTTIAPARELQVNYNVTIYRGYCLVSHIDSLGNVPHTDQLFASAAGGSIVYQRVPLTRFKIEFSDSGVINSYKLVILK